MGKRAFLLFVIAVMAVSQVACFHRSSSSGEVSHHPNQILQRVKATILELTLQVENYHKAGLIDDEKRAKADKAIVEASKAFNRLRSHYLKFKELKEEYKASVDIAIGLISNILKGGA